MNFKPSLLAMAVLFSGAASATVTLTGHDLTQEDAWKVAAGEEVAIAPAAMKQLTDSHNLVMAAARSGVEI